MDVGLSIPNRALLYGGTHVEEVYQLAETADRDGWHSVWVGDGLVAKPRVEALVVLAALAARTRRARLGVCCLATFPLRHPVLFAAQWASLDVMSAGRTELAVCLGIPTGRGGSNFRAELDAMGVAPRDRVPRLEEGIEVVRKLWSSTAGAPATHAGITTTFADLVLEPRPVQQPCPVWIASNPDPAKLDAARFATAVDRVARLADGWQTTVIHPAEFGDRWALIRDRAVAHGRAAQDLRSSLHLMVHLADDVASARAGGKAFLDRYYGMDTPDEVLDRWGAYGPPELVAERIAAYVERGLDLPILRFAAADQTGQYERAMADLLPLLGAPAAAIPS
ncbi:MAG: LLM class flavin-dependent oxidoreductase [Acidimicrobiia bacterium]